MEQPQLSFWLDRNRFHWVEVRHCLHREIQSSQLPPPPQCTTYCFHDPHKLNVQLPTMTLLVSRVACARFLLHNAGPAPSRRLLAGQIKHANFSSTCSVSYQKVEKEKKVRSDPRINLLGRAIEDEFATIRENYGSFATASS